MILSGGAWARVGDSNEFPNLSCVDYDSRVSEFRTPGSHRGLRPHGLDVHQSIQLRRSLGGGGPARIAAAIRAPSDRYPTRSASVLFPVRLHVDVAGFRNAR